MSKYLELPIEQIEIDRDNPRIAHSLIYYDERDITAELLALLLSTSAQATENLRESIKQNGGIIHPIIVRKIDAHSYQAIEGNTRLQLYKDFKKNGVKGNWDTIKAIIHETIAEQDVHAIRLQAHLVGPREWDSYSKAKYLNHLYNVENMPISHLISLCGGNSKASEIKSMIAAYKDMEEHYRPLCEDDSQFDIKKFQGFVQLQNKKVSDGLIGHGYNKTDFSKWVFAGKFSRLEHIRDLPEILNSKKAKERFLKEGSAEAIKVLAVEEVKPNSLADIPYEVLAKELSKRVVDITHLELMHLRDDAEYSDRLQSLRNVCDDIKNIILNEIDGE
ncbi:MAG: ParB N-terminal domain-containing protein [Firmicutes bacterium]|nr:ParB N-terminal domain-containing protein [Bacillota bacterium]